MGAYNDARPLSRIFFRAGTKNQPKFNIIALFTTTLICYHSRFLEVCHSTTLCKRLLYTLPRSYFNVFKYLCAFLRELLKYNNDNKHTVQSLSTTFGLIFMRNKHSKDGKENHERQRVERERKGKFVSHFLYDHFQW